MEEFDIPQRIVDILLIHAPAGWIKMATVYFRGSGSLSSSGFDMVALWREGAVEFEQPDLLPGDAYFELSDSLRALLPEDWRSCVVSVDVTGEVRATLERGGEDEDLDMSESPLQYLLQNEVAELTELGERVYGRRAKRRFWSR